MSADFDSHADSYRDDVNRAIAFAGKNVEFYAQRKAEMLADLVREIDRDPRDRSVLDVGCGIGLVDTFLIGTFGEVAGVDLSEEEIARARRDHPQASYSRSDPERIPFPDGRFDLAFAANVLHHAPQPHVPLIIEMARTVRAGGLVVVFEHNPLNPLTRRVVSRIPFDEGVTLLRSREVVGLFESAGLDEVIVRNMTFVPFAGRVASFLERRLARVPFGAQYAVIGHKSAL